MTFSINPTGNKTQAAFKALAMQQNGTMTEGTGSYTAPPPPPAATPPASAPPPANLAAPPAPSVASGSGGAECACSCFCGVAAFPPGVGVGMFGGLPGSSTLSRQPVWFKADSITLQDRCPLHESSPLQADRGMDHMGHGAL